MDELFMNLNRTPVHKSISFAKMPVYSKMADPFRHGHGKNIEWKSAPGGQRKRCRH